MRRVKWPKRLCDRYGRPRRHPSMLDVIVRCAACGALLTQTPSGYWTYPMGHTRLLEPALYQETIKDALKAVGFDDAGALEVFDFIKQRDEFATKNEVNILEDQQ